MRLPRIQPAAPILAAMLIGLALAGLPALLGAVRHAAAAVEPSFRVAAATTTWSEIAGAPTGSSLSTRGGFSRAPGRKASAS